MAQTTFEEWRVDNRGVPDPFFCAHYFADNYGPYTHPWGVRAKMSSTQRLAYAVVHLRTPV